MKRRILSVLLCVLCIITSSDFVIATETATDTTGTIVDVKGAVYQNNTVERDGVVWRLSDSVTGQVDTMGTTQLTDDVFQDGTIVEPVSYLNERGNIELSTADKATVVEQTRYDAYIYASDNTHDGAMFAKGNFSGDFDLETRLKYDELFHISLYTGTNRFYIDFLSDSELNCEDENGIARTVEVNLGYNQWHTIKFSVRNKNIGTIFIDGKEVITYNLRKTTNSAMLQFYTKHLSDSKNTAEIEYVKLTPVTSDMTITSISYGQSFAEGDTITLQSSKSGFLSAASYYINGKLVATDNWKGSTSLSDMKAGVYDIVAQKGSAESAPVRIYVKPKQKEATLSAPESVVYGNNINVTLSTTNISSISRVEYYLNGKLSQTVAQSPYSAVISNARVGTAAIYAKVVASDGAVVFSIPASVNVIHDGYTGSIDISREYMLDYTYTDAKQTGKIKIDDGYFSLDFIHNGTTITYQNTDGEQSYEILGDGDGTGSFKVVVTAGNAEVYYNNHFAFACFLPYTQKKSGIFYYENVSDINIQGSGVKCERYYTDWDGHDEISDYNMNIGLYYSAEFNKDDSSDETLIVYDGEYQAKLMFDERGITAVAQFEDYREQEEFNLSQTITVGYYRLTVARGIAQLFVNNEYINSFMCPAVAHGDAVLRKVSNPDATDFVSVKDTDDIYYHNENFEGNTEYPADEYFVSEYDSIAKEEGEAETFTHSIENVDGSKVMKLWGVGDYALNANSKYPTMKWRAKADGTGTISFICRYQQKGNYVAVNYDFANKRWYIDDAKIASEKVTNDDGTTSTVYSEGHTEKASVDAELDTNWHEYEIVIDGTTLTLYCDNTAVISWNELEAGSGRIGFGVLDNATLYIDDLVYAGEGKASPGLSYIFGREMGGKEFYRSNDGYIWTGSASKKQFVSKDNGETWEPVEDAYSANNSIRLLSGRFLRTGQAFTGWAPYQTYSFTFDADADWQKSATSWDLNLWANGDNLIEPDDPYASGFYAWSTMPSRLMQVQDGPYKGRIFYARGFGGERHGGTSLFYTDGDFDEKDIRTYTVGSKTGKSFIWHSPQTSFAYESIGINNQESLVVDMPDGSLRYCARTDTGFLCYSESFDGGVTWSKFKPMQLISPRCCFGLVRDPDTLNNQYAVWEYDVNSADKQNDGGRPRCRTAFAMTSDGMANWKYIMDLQCLTENWRTSKTSQNHAMRVIDNKAYISLSGTGGAYSEIIVIDLSVSKPLLRFPGAHERVEGYLDLWDWTSDYTVLSKTGERGLVNGEIYENIGSNGKFTPEIMAKVLGANISVSGETATFTLGSATVTAAIDNGMVDAKECAAAFGKLLTEAEDSYIISKAPVAGYNLYQLDGMGAERTVAQENSAMLLHRINQAAMYGNDENIKTLVTSNLADMDITADLSQLKNPDNVYSRMTGYTYYAPEDVNSVMISAAAAQAKAEQRDSNLAISTVSGGTADWISHGDSIDSSFSVNDGVATITKSRTEGEANLGTLAFDVPECDDYYVTFKVKADDGNAHIMWGNATHLIKLVLNEDGLPEFGVQKDEIPIQTTSGLWYEYKVTVSKSDTGRIVDIQRTESTTAVDEELVYENVSGTSGKKGFWIGMQEGTTGTVHIKDVRVYQGKAYDVLSLSVNEGKASASIDILNDKTEFNGGWLVMNMFNKNIFAGAGFSAAATGIIAPLESKNVQINEFDYTKAENIVPEIQLLMWKDLVNMQPIFTPVTIKEN